ncbi:hypothetical protein VHEMI03424 [[Torrubiella] hemipterigena]|nr:hypothetical protein VHEMI03424 [[Torrubiella] hemipterigena]
MKILLSQLLQGSLLALCVAMPSQRMQASSQPTDDLAVDDVQDQDNMPRPAKFPGFNNMIQTSDPPTDSTVPADAAFNATCRHVTLNGYGRVGETTLEADCKDRHGVWWHTAINLNNCIGNSHGSLVYSPGGNFDKTCRPCFIDGTQPGKDVLLKCNCLEKPGAVPMYTSLQIGTMVDDVLAVKPVGAQFTCGSYNGTKSPFL